MTLQVADLIAIASLSVAIAALAVALYAVFRGNRNTAAATLVTINEAFRQAWERLLSKLNTLHTSELADLMNLLETACAIHSEGSLAGVSQVLMKQYLDSVLKLLVDAPNLNAEISTLLQEPHTFVYIKGFLKKERKELSVTIPLEWYESYT